MSGPFPVYYNVPVEAQIVPLKDRYTGSVGQWSVPISCGTSDSVVSATLRVSPSGDGELVISDLVVSGNTLTWTSSGGQPGRQYTFEALVNLEDGDVIEIGIVQITARILITDTAQEAPSIAFGTPITWNFVPSLNFSIPANSQYLLLFPGL
jgi:hypothetical protein